ncbi:MAG: hypothetical protein WCJ14_01005 [Verrucomicrobiota bacterium]
MTRRFASILFAACLLLLAGCPALLRAQSAPDKPGVEFSCVVWEQPPISAVVYRDGKSYLPLVFSLGNRSQLYPLKESSAFELYEKAVGADGTTTYKLVGKAPIIAGARRMLFLIDQVANSTGLPLRVFGVNDALDVFPPGTFRFVNFSSAALQVKFGGETNKLPAGEMRVVKSHVSPKGGFLPFFIGDASGKIIFETRLFGQPSGRDMVFIGPPTKPGNEPMVKFLTEIIPPAPPKPGG